MIIIIGLVLLASVSQVELFKFKHVASSESFAAGPLLVPPPADYLQSYEAQPALASQAFEGEIKGGVKGQVRNQPTPVKGYQPAPLLQTYPAPGYMAPPAIAYLILRPIQHAQYGYFDPMLHQGYAQAPIEQSSEFEPSMIQQEAAAAPEPQLAEPAPSVEVKGPQPAIVETHSGLKTAKFLKLKSTLGKFASKFSLGTQQEELLAPPLAAPISQQQQQVEEAPIKSQQVEQQDLKQTQESAPPQAPLDAKSQIRELSPKQTVQGQGSVSLQASNPDEGFKRIGH